MEGGGGKEEGSMRRTGVKGGGEGQREGKGEEKGEKC